MALTDLPITETLATTLATQAATLAEAVRANLANPPGGPHDQPWRETGSLQASITTTTDALTAQIASNHPAAAAQELGTSTAPPRPFRPRRRIPRRTHRPRHRPVPRRPHRTPAEIARS